MPSDDEYNELVLQVYNLEQRVNGLQDMIEKLYIALGSSKGEPIITPE